ncbi:MAG: hypothetical protein IJ294_05290 [Clostridia bacterium]|nr:hypothetical protein [Clostridia bacterium]
MKFKTYCAANSGDGFISFFDTILNEKRSRIYYIKGGPGCGKSTFMKAIANQATDAELIYCSGDPNSLDGVILPKQNAVIIDATKPHSFEPKYPGVGGNIIDLGEGWDPAKMNAKKIMDLCDQKSDLYSSCYRLLKAAADIHAGTFAPLYKYIDFEKIQKVGNKILMQNALWENKNRRSKILKRFLSAISPDGMHTLSETVHTLGKNIILLEDRWMIAAPFLNYIDQQLSKRGIDHINSYHPLLGKETLHHIIVPQAGLSIISKDGYFDFSVDEEQIIKKINLQNMLDKTVLDSNKNKFSFIKRIQREILNLATDKLKEARNIHMQIEQEYAIGTDFKATEHLKKNLMSKLFNET